MHQIVSRAEELLPTLDEADKLPTNALFAALNDLSGELGIREDDRHLFSLIFKIGGERGTGTLLDKFRAVLERHGIVLEIVDDAEAEVDRTSTQAPEIESPRPPRGAPLALAERSPKPLPNVCGESTETSEQVTAGASDGRSLVDVTSDRPPVNAGLNRYKYLEQEPHHAIEGYHSAGDDTDQSRPSPHSLLVSGEYPGTSNTTVQSREDRYSSDGLTDDREAAFYERQSVQVLLRSVLREWRLNARLVETQTYQQEHLALAQDRRALLGPALESWRSVARQRVNERIENEAAAEEDAHFDALARRATRARDLYLVTKAFSHWLVCASEKVERTSVARRHMLRFRYFDLWQQVTTASMLAVRRLAQSRSLRIWSHKHSLQLGQEQTLLAAWKAQLQRQLLYRWYCEKLVRDALVRRDVSLSGRMFHEWTSAAQNTRELGDAAAAVTRRQLALFFGQWRTRANATQQRTRVGLETRHRQTEALHIDQWRRHLQLVKASRQADHARATLAMRKVFDTWTQKLRSQRPQLPDSRKMKADVLSSWRLKCRLVRSRRLADQELKERALQQWFYNDLGQWAARMHQRKLLAKAFGRLRVETRSSSSTQIQAQCMAVSFRTERVGHRTLQLWTQQTRHFAQVEEEGSRLARWRRSHAAIVRWKDAKAHEDEILSWANRFSYFSLVTRVIGKWNAKAREARKRRLNKLLTQMRQRRDRKAKTHCLGAFARKLQAQRELLMLGDNVRSVVEAKTATRCIAAWRAKRQGVVELDIPSGSAVLQRCLTRWRARSANAQAGEYDASEHWTSTVETRCFKRWALSSLRLSSRAHSLLQVQEKSSRRMLRKVFVYWSHQTAVRLHFQASQAAPGGSQIGLAGPVPWASLGPTTFGDSLQSMVAPGAAPSPMKSDARDTDDPDDVGRAAVADDGTETMVSTPTRPKFATTATARHVAVTRLLPSTTPIAPLPPRLERQLRQQYGSGSAGAGLAASSMSTPAGAVAGTTTPATMTLARSGRSINVARSTPRVPFAELRRIRDARSARME